MKRIIAATIAAIALASTLAIPTLASADEPVAYDPDVHGALTVIGDDENNNGGGGELIEYHPGLDGLVELLPNDADDGGDDDGAVLQGEPTERPDPCDYQHLEVVQKAIADGRLECPDDEPQDDPGDSSTWVRPATPHFTG